MARNLKLWAPLAALAALAPLVNADADFTSPKAGASLTGGTSITITWEESNDTPLIADLLTYQISLCMGSSDVMECPLDITTGAKTFAVTGNQVSGLIGTGLGASTPKNAYFLRMTSAATGGTVTNFSPRFTLTGMTGTFSSAVIAALKTVTGTDGPARIDDTTDTAATSSVAGDYGVEYTMQTDLTRFAPMQIIPPTKISKKDMAPQYPTSNVQTATTWLPIAKQLTTVTESQTFSIKSVENSAAAAPMPSDDMAKFLNRWKD